jgi:hypothetical protein
MSMRRGVSLCVRGAREAVCGLAVLAGLAAMPSVSFAQGGMVWFEVGQHDSRYGDGRTKTGTSAGGGVTVTIGGSAGRKTGVIVPVGFEIKGNWGGGLDWVGTGDLGIRIRSVSFGPGANMSFLNRVSAADNRCKTGPFTPKTSCYTDGTRDMGGFFSLGVSGFVKVNFGPQGRAFVQGRYIYYPRSTTDLLSTSEMSELFGILASSLSQTPTTTTTTTEAFHPDDFPEFDKAHETRVSAGWVFGGVKRGAMVLRVQYVERDYRLTPTLANTNRMFDQKTTQITAGLGFAF